jgi:uncharacterized protein (TIGR03382 family)
MKAALVAMLLATPNFPGVIQQQLRLAQPPPCTVCHATNAGGAGTAVKPFGIYLQSRGLVPFDEASLRNALLADIAERHSSSGGLTDVDALRAGEDPNGAQASNLVPAYGCSSAGSTVDLLTLYALGAWLLRRNRGSNLRRRHAAKRLRGSWSCDFESRTPICNSWSATRTRWANDSTVMEFSRAQSSR